MSVNTPLKPYHERGMVLVVVLWIIALLSIMAASLAYSTRTETALATHHIERAQARALAEASVAYGVIHALSPNASEIWSVDGVTRDWHLGPGQARVRIIDASGKIDLNHANRELLRGLFTNAGVAEEEVDGLLDVIEDWRDPDDERRLNGAEEDDYLAADRSSGPRNAPFESVEELQQVLGMTQALYEQIYRELTVYSKQAGINPAMASAAVLKAVPGMDPEVVDEYFELRAESIDQDLPLPSPPNVGSYLARSQRLAYHVSVEARTEGDARLFVEAAVALERGRSRRNTGLIYKILAWREDK